MKKIMTAMLVGIITLLLVPGVAGAEGSCAERCLEAGTESVEECVQGCEEYITLGEGGNIECLFEIIGYCALTPSEAVKVIKLAGPCFKHGFDSSECHDKSTLCSFDESCIKSICCGTGDKNCLSTWKKYCNK